MHQLAVLSTGWAAFFHSTPDGVHQSPSLFAADHCTFFFWFVLDHFFLNLTSHIATLITSYHTDLATILTTYPTNLATLLTNTLLT
jgi:hypothetical protein